MLFELIWQYRFLYRDLNDLLVEQPASSRRTSSSCLQSKTQAVQAVLDGLGRGAGALASSGRDAEPVATAMVVVLTYWLSFEYVREPAQGARARERRARRCCAAPSTC